MDKIYANTQSVYERRAKHFDATRVRDGREQKWLEMFVETVPAGGSILDLGCGTGEPIASWLIKRGFRVTGIDYSEPMLAMARERFPGETWAHGDMRDLQVSGPFNGIISWHGSFHLTADEQRALIKKLAQLLDARGSLMLTTGPAAGEATGTVGGETVYHASLAPEAYRDLLEREGFTEIHHHTDDEAEGPFVLRARR